MILKVRFFTLGHAHSHTSNMVKQSTTDAVASEPLGPGRALAQVNRTKCGDILGVHKNRKRFRERTPYAHRHTKELLKREGIVRASKPTGPAIYYESVVAPVSDLVWLTTSLVQRSGKSIVKAWHLENVNAWVQGTAALDPELASLPKIPRKWRKQYEEDNA